MTQKAQKEIKFKYIWLKVHQLILKNRISFLRMPKKEKKKKKEKPDEIVDIVEIILEFDK